ncbi:MAG TPA: hypothetical protein VGJ05_20510 [Fimbriiglobus sp.]
MPVDPARTFLRHTVAALSYRAARACENTPPGFDLVRAADSTRTAGQILAHMGDLFDWATSHALGAPVWNVATPMSWGKEVARFFAALAQFDAVLAAETPLACPAERLFQGPIADAITHVGQLAMLRRLAGSPMLGENYYKADIMVGQIHPLPSPAVAPFA